MALSADLDNLRMTELSGRGYEMSIPVKTGVTIYKGAHVVTDATGYAIPLAVTGAVQYVGRAQEQVVNAGASGSVNVKVMRQGIVWVPFTSAAVTDLGFLLWATADDTATLTPQANCGALGRVVKVEVGVGNWVDQSDNVNAHAV